MKKIKMLVIIAALALSLCLSGCEILGPLDSNTGGGGVTDIPGGEEQDGSGDGSNDGEENKGDGLGEETHVCDLILKSYMKSTCTVQGKEFYECSCGKSEERTVALAAHTEEIIPATDKTENSPAKTEGKKCSVCGYIIVAPNVVFADDYENPEKYDGDYAYNYISTLENGDKLTKLYNSIDKCADVFHVSGDDAGENLVVAEINFGELGLTSDEALAVWSAYCTDHPVYYWISKKVSYTDESLSIKVDAEYASGAERNALNSEIYAAAKKFVTAVRGESEYSVALTLHDLIISAGDYRYESDGVTPEDSAYAHNVLGMMVMGGGVCESYAKSFQMLLNYCGIENVLVSGYAGEAHAWNLVKLDDGRWYWCDLTWDDKPGFMWGVSHRYFAVGESDALMDMDGPWTVPEEAFETKHFPSAKCDTGIGFVYALPEASEVSFASSELLIRTTFKSGDFTYAILDFDSVQLVKIESEGDVVIPEKVEYAGRSFDVVSIGRIDEFGLFKTGSLVSEYYDKYGNLSIKITSLYIPKTVSLIWDDALNIQSLEAITVSEDNAAYASLDGVLYTKYYKTLVKYPSARDAEIYTLPDATENIAAYAINMYFTNIELPNLNILELGSNTADAGIAHFGYGYEDAENGNYREGEWDRIKNYLGADGRILQQSGEKTEPAAAV